MQRTESIDAMKIDDLLIAIFEERTVVYEAYSKPDSDLKEFADSIDLKNYIETELLNGERFIQIAIYYSDSNGFVEKREINLDPQKCKGALKRYSIDGWGLINFQIDYGNIQTPKCRIAVNTEKRASAWSSTFPNKKSPDLWDWKLVEKNARRLIRVLRKCA